MAPPISTVCSVDHDQLLVISEQVSTSIARVEHAISAARFGELGEEFRRRRGAEPVDQELYIDAAPSGVGQRLSDSVAVAVGIEHVHQHLDAVLRARDQIEQKLESLLSRFDQL